MIEDSLITVDLNTISDNLKKLKSYCAAGVQQMAVVKANAYGHGLVSVARAVSGQVEWFAVNSIQEAVTLRENGIGNSILVFGVPDESNAKLYQKHSITATVSSFESLNVLSPGTEYHLNFDTGMGRLGFRPEQAEKIRKQVAQHANIDCTGIYSHFATADEPASPKGKQQLQLFQKLRNGFPNDLLTHMCNTAATVQYPEAHFDLVRNGIGIYGYAPGKVKVDLSPALSWSTKLIQIKHIKKSETVSYGATWAADKEGFLGVIPVGYSDGIPRRLSGKFDVLINDKRYPAAGTVTMNYCMVWLGKEKVKTGTGVQLMFEGSTAQTWAEKTGTIPYEILTGLSQKIPRRYISL